MFEKIADNRNQQSLAAKFRRKRFALFQSLLARLSRPVNILDVGGTEDYWKTMRLDLKDQITITLLNLNHIEITLPNVTSIVGDARKTNLKDESFDVVFSNSVIEHVGAYQDQIQMAKEVQRVGKRYFVQTPNKYFPLEPHFLFPFFQFLPTRLRVMLLHNFNLGWFKKTADVKKAQDIVESIQLLNKKDFVSIFPDASLYEEKVLGLTKSFVVYGGWER